MKWVIAASMLAANCLLVPVPAYAQHDDGAVTVGPVTVDHPWMRATRNTTNGAHLFLSIRNTGATPITLTGARADVAGRIEAAGHWSKGGKTSLQPLGPVQIAPGRSFEFAPDGAVLWLQDLKSSLAEGQEIEVILTVAPVGDITLDVDVGAANAKGPSHAGHKH